MKVNEGKTLWGGLAFYKGLLATLVPRAFFISIFTANNPRYQLKYFFTLTFHP